MMGPAGLPYGNFDVVRGWGVIKIEYDVKINIGPAGLPYGKFDVVRGRE